jgi:hypothetical protein
MPGSSRRATAAFYGTTNLQDDSTQPAPVRVQQTLFDGGDELLAVHGFISLTTGEAS